MKGIVRNIILIFALSSVLLMVVGMFLYDYLPNTVAVTKANTYEADSSTTKVLADITEETETLFSGNSNEDESNSSPNIVLRTYTVTNTDLKQYVASGDYEVGKADPFAEAPKKDNVEDGSNPSSGANGNNTTNNLSDGTLFNSTKTK